MLWFDVEKKNYTTFMSGLSPNMKLWFDVEKKNYTTIDELPARQDCCGLM